MFEQRPKWAVLLETDASRIWREVLIPLSVELHASAGRIAEQIVSQSVVEFPAQFVDEHHVLEATAGTEETMVLLARLLELGADPALSEMPASTVAIVRSSIWRHLPLSTHLRFLRHGHEQVWQWMVDRIRVAALSPEDRAQAVELITIMLMRFVDRAMVMADQVYEGERETWFQGAAASRAAAIEDVLAGNNADQQALSSRARYDLGRYHLGTIVWLDQAGDRNDVLSFLGGVVTTIGRSAGVESSVSHPMGSLAVAGWFSSRRPFDPEVVELLTGDAVRLPDGVHVAFGELGHGVGGFRRTHREAEYARRAATLLSLVPVSVTRYDDIAVLSLGMADPEHASRFVARTLGHLADSTDAAYRLAETVEAFLAEGSSRSRAAKRLSLHPNTVSYRVKQAEDLLGRSVATDTLQLRLALTLLPAVRRLDHDHRPQR